MAKILVTGTAGFIGYHLAKALLKKGNTVVGIDNINDYYDVGLKYARLANTGIDKETIVWDTEVKSSVYENYSFVRVDLQNKQVLQQLFEKHQFDVVVNLAAQAGVRYSIENPDAYVESNIVGFVHILECCRHAKVKHLLYASSSSVYGTNTKMPFSTDDNVDTPISLYAATKKSNELMAYTYSHLYHLPTTGLRFFTVYGPWGRPDMALFLFTKAMLNNEPIKVFNEGNMERDFTYIDDIVNGIEVVLANPPEKTATQPAYRVANIGNGKPVALMAFISEIEKNLKIKAQKDLLPMQPGDVPKTWADTSKLEQLGYESNFSIQQGVKNFIDWYKEYYKIS